MDTFVAFVEKYLVPPLTKLGEIKFLRAVRNGVVATVPFTIFGSLFLILSSFPVQAWLDFVAPWSNLLQVPFKATFGLLSVIVSVSIAYNYARELKQDAITGALMSLIGFMLLQVDVEKLVISTDKFDASGMFSAIIIAWLAVQLQRFFIQRNLVIKLPENVPPAVARSFISLTPLATLLTIIWLLRFVCGIDINVIINMIFQPLVFALNTLPGVMLAMLLISLLWSVGIHGDNVMMAVISPIALKFIAENAKAMLAHQPLPYITADGFIPMFINIGGTGATLGLVINLLRSRDAGLKDLGRLAFPSACFQINEPVVFGVPIVLNPLMIIPYIILPQILVVGTYLLMYFDVIARPCIAVPWTTPPIIGHYLVTGGDWRALVWGAISTGIAVLAYLPFLRSLERNRAAEAISGNN